MNPGSRHLLNIQTSGAHPDLNMDRIMGVLGETFRPLGHPSPGSSPPRLGFSAVSFPAAQEAERIEQVKQNRHAQKCLGGCEPGPDWWRGWPGWRETEGEEGRAVERDALTVGAPHSSARRLGRRGPVSLIRELVLHVNWE